MGSDEPSDEGTGSSNVDSSGGGISSIIVPSFIRRRFVLKLSVWMLIVVVLIALVGGVGYIRAQETVSDNTDRQLQSTAALQSDSVSEWTSEMKDQTASIARDDTAGADDPGAVQNHIDQQTSSFSYTVRNVHVLDLDDDEVVASTAPSSHGVAMGDVEDPWGEPSQYENMNPSADNVTVSDSSYQGELGQDVYFATKVPSHHNRVVVLVAGISQHVQMLHQPYNDQQTAIVDTSGSSRIVGDEGTALPSGLISGETVVDETNGTIVEEDGNVYAATPVQGTDWALVTTVPQSTVYETVNIVEESMLIVVGVGLISVLGVAAIIGRQTAVPITRLRNKAQTMEDGDLDVDLRTGRIDEIGQLYGGFATMRDSLKEQITEAENARESAEAARRETERTNEHLERKADEYSRVMQECAQGNFTQRMDPESDNEAMRSIAREFNEMIDAIEKTTAHVKRFATEVATASEEVTASSEEVRNASEQVSTSIQRISDGAERQHEHLEEATVEINTLSSATEEIASSSDEVADIAERTAEAGTRGREAANDAADDMNAVAADTDEVVAQFERLKEETEQIDELIEFIEEIAKRTNMLALNANIEASRSQEASGEGFGVVAQEVKELSEETQEATEKIQKQLTSLQREADDAADVVERTSDQVTESVDSVEDAVEALENIAAYAERTNEGVQEISTASDDQASSASEVASMVDNVADISQETSRESESVAASAEEQTSALTQVSQNAGNLAEQASQLSSVLDNFETDVDVGEIRIKGSEDVPIGDEGEDGDSVIDGDASQPEPRE